MICVKGTICFLVFSSVPFVKPRRAFTLRKESFSKPEILTKSCSIRAFLTEKGWFVEVPAILCTGFSPNFTEKNGER